MTIQTLRTKTIIINNQNLERKAFWVIFSALAFFAVCYAYMIGMMTFDILARRNMESYSKVLVSEIGRLETERIALSKSIDLNYSNQLGFAEPKKVYFASPESAVKSLTLNVVR